MRKKIEKKNADVIIGNYIEDALYSTNNSVEVLYKDGNLFSVEKMSKIDLAFTLIKQIFSKKIEIHFH